jgi:hypothetical protein
MMEYWFSKEYWPFYFIANPAGGGTINPTLHSPIRSVGRNPLLHYSIIPSFPPGRRRYPTGRRPIVSEAN